MMANKANPKDVYRPPGWASLPNWEDAPDSGTHSWPTVVDGEGKQGTRRMNLKSQLEPRQKRGPEGQ